jgi:membrane-bound lytic murein transglycosylase D
MWQFMEGTAGDFGMEVGPLLDERRDPFKSTAAAVRYLSRLHGEFDSWFFALAAYNGGPGRARRIARRYAPLSQASDSLFWALRAHFPRETRDFVPKLIGAIVVASAPQRYGHEVERGGRLRYDDVEVPDATTLDIVARAAGTSLEEVERLNPQLLRGITPPGRRYTLRVPEGLGARFTTSYAAIPPAERVSFVEHRVVQAETLSHIARRYRLSVAELEAANPSVRARYMRVGARLTVPLASSARRSGR